MDKHDNYKKLGFWSSHPEALEKSRNIFVIIACLPLVIFIVVLVLVCSDFDACKNVLMHPGWPAKLSLTVACLSAGAVFCVCLMTFLSIYLPSGGEDKDKDRKPFSPWLILFFALAWLAPWSLSFFRNKFWDGPYFGLIEFVLNFICLAPFFWLCIYLWFRTRGEKNKRKASLPFWPLIIGIVALIVAALPLFTDMQSGIVKLLPNWKVIKTIDKTIIRLFLFGLFFPIGTMFLCLWDFFRKSKFIAETGNLTSKDIPTKSKTAADIVKELNDFVAADAKSTWSENLNQDSSDVSPRDKQKDDFKIGVLFPGFDPMPCQTDFLRTFINLYEEHVERVVNNNAEDNTSIDIIISGERGSGRTEALCAASLLAVLSRGDKVLYLVKDDLSARIVEKRINNMLKLMSLAEESGQYIKVDRISEDCLSNWVEEENYVAAAPDVLIASPSAFENEIFSAELSADEHLRAIDILLEYSTILVDDWFECSFSTQAHLVFLLRKLRLLLSANGRFSQLVMVAPDGTSVESMKKPFPFENNKAEVFYFKPRNDFKAWHGCLETEDTSSSLEICGGIADLCAADGLKLLIYSSVSIDDEFKSKHQSRDVVIVKSIEECELDHHDFYPDVILCLARQNEITTTALKCNLMRENSVLLYIQDKNYPDIVSKTVEMLLPDNSSRALCLTHLRSLLPFILPKQPISEDIWNLFGIRGNSDFLTSEEPSSAHHQVDFAYDILRGNGYDIKAEIALLTNLMSAAAKKIDYGSFPDDTEILWEASDRSANRQIHMSEVDDKGLSKRYARWEDGEGNPLGKTDLANGDSLVCVHKGVRYYCDSIDSGPAEDYAMMLIGRECNNTDDDYIIQERSMGWELTKDIEVSEKLQDKKNFIARFNVSENDININCSLTGRINLLGQPKGIGKIDGDINQYSFRANLSGIVLSSAKDFISLNIPSGEWGTGKNGYSAFLTHALTAALRSRFNGFNFYASLLAFVTRDEKRQIGDVLIWIVEPENSGRICSKKIFEKLENDTGLIEDVFRDALHIVEESRNGSIDQLRIQSGVAYFGETLDRKDADEALDILEEVLSFLEKPVAENDYKWMSASKEFDSTSFQPDSIWKEQTVFPKPPEIGRSGVNCIWHYDGKEFSISMGFEEADGKERYNGFLDNSFVKRTCGDCYIEYGFNDPYREFIDKLCGKLRKMFDEKIPNASAAQIAECLLAFVQEGFPYVPDPEIENVDWPRHPSETIMHEGGDCEDSSILYAELLRRFNIDGAILLTNDPAHASVGVKIPLPLPSNIKNPVIIKRFGGKYIYAETANNRFITPLGTETELLDFENVNSVKVIPTPNIPEDNSTPVRIINAVRDNSGSREITLVSSERTNKPLVIAVFARPQRNVFEAPDKKSYPCIGGAKLPPLEARKVYTAKLELQTPDFRTYFNDIFVCEDSTGVVRGHLVGVVFY